MIFKDEVRYCWHHFVEKRKLDKVCDKIHFRKHRVTFVFKQKNPSGVCTCKFPAFCNSQGFDQVGDKILQEKIMEEQNKNDNKSNLPSNLEKKYEFS